MVVNVLCADKVTHTNQLIYMYIVLQSIKPDSDTVFDKST